MLSASSLSAVRVTPPDPIGRCSRLFREKAFEISRLHNTYGAVSLEYQQVFVSGHDVLSMRLARTGKNSVIVRVSAHWSNGLDPLKHFFCGSLGNQLCGAEGKGDRGAESL